MAEVPRVEKELTDPRYTLANERTMLAWTRTALALIAAGLAFIQFIELVQPGGRRLIGVALIIIGSLVALVSGGEWRRREQAIREGRPIDMSWLGWVVTIGVAVTGEAATVVVVTGVGAP